jgi:hypothetical protein
MAFIPLQVLEDARKEVPLPDAITDGSTCCLIHSVQLLFMAVSQWVVQQGV